MVAHRLPQPLTRCTAEEYLEEERRAEYKSEYRDGVIVAMSGGSRAHSVITVNITAEVRARLKGKPCQAFSNDMKVRSGIGELYSYPDLSVVCGEPRFHDDHTDVLLNPTVIVEALSPSTEAFDRGRKFARYQRIASLMDYVLIAQDEPRVERYARQEDGQWLLSIAVGLEAVLSLPSIDCSLPLSEIYDRVPFPAAPDETDAPGATHQ